MLQIRGVSKIIPLFFELVVVNSKQGVIFVMRYRKRQKKKEIMNAVFLITETLAGNKVDQLGCSHHYLKDARKDLMSHLNRLSSSDDVNEIQPTMNFKDRFHFWIDGEKRHIVISKYYKSERCSLRMKWEAEEKLNDFSSPI